MKFIKLKTLLASSLIGAMALVSLPAQAVPQVEFWGWMQKFIETDNISGCEGDICKPGVRLSSFISKVGIKVTEPMHDTQEGLKFIFHLDTAYFSDAPTDNQHEAGPRSRDISIGDERALAKFENKRLGYSIGFGRDAHTLWKVLRSVAPLGDLHGTILGEIHSRQKLRINNATFISYTIPKTGLTVNTEYGFSERDGKEDKMGGGLDYRPHKDIRLTLNHFQSGEPSAGFLEEDNSTLLTAGYYGIENWKFVIYHSDDRFKDVDSRGTSYHVFNQITPKWSVGAVYGHRDTSSVKGYQLGANYAFTKNLTLQMRATHQTADEVIKFTTPNDLGGLNGTDRTNLGVGLRFTF